MTDKKLIFDIGMNIGDDTAYYLKLGYKVVAVEANPVLTKQCSLDFASAIKYGDLVIINKGIGDQQGSFNFWINNNNSEWSSFDYNLAHKKGTTVTKVPVETITLRDLFIQHGVPYYLKIDIEGYDEFCLRQIIEEDKPKYVSCEANTSLLLDILRDKGYKKFKMINQASGFSPFSKIEEGLYIPSLVSKIFWRIKSKLVPAIFGDSGPFAEQTKGDWKSFQEVKSDFHFYYRNENKPINRLSWYDFHASY